VELNDIIKRFFNDL